MACAAVKQSGGILITENEAASIIADNAALMAEISALNESLKSERAATEKMVMDYDGVISADSALIEKYKASNLLLEDEIALKDKTHAAELKAVKRKGWQRMILGFVVGALAGAAIN